MLKQRLYKKVNNYCKSVFYQNYIVQSDRTTGQSGKSRISRESPQAGINQEFRYVTIEISDKYSNISNTCNLLKFQEIW